MKRGDSEGRIDRRSAEHSIVNALRRIMRSIRLSAVSIQAATGISAAQLYVLRQLSEDRNGVSIGELATKTLTDRSSVAAAVDRLVALEMAERTTSSKDRRRAEIRITPSGERLVAGAIQPPTSQIVAALEMLSDADLATLEASLSSLVHAMGLEKTPATMFFEDPVGGEAGEAS